MVKHKYHAKQPERLQRACDSFCTLAKGVIVRIPLREVQNEKSGVRYEERLIKDERGVGIGSGRADRVASLMASLDAGEIGTWPPRCGEGREEPRVGR